MATLIMLLGIFISLILKGIMAENFPMANRLAKHTMLCSLASLVRIQPQSFGDCMEHDPDNTAFLLRNRIDPNLLRGSDFRILDRLE